jgi:hypothetical protein
MKGLEYGPCFPTRVSQWWGTVLLNLRHRVKIWQLLSTSKNGSLIFELKPRILLLESTKYRPHGGIMIVDLLIKVACFVTKLNNMSVLK